MLRKKILLILVLVFASSSMTFASSYLDKQIKQNKASQNFNNVQRHTAEYSADFLNAKKMIDIKDPNLITFKTDSISPISDDLFSKKVKSDENYYKSNVLPIFTSCKKTSKALIDDYYRIYKIADRLIRANNLDYINWRFCLVSNAEDINAYATAVNYIIIYSSVIDSFEGNDDALAFIIAHELSHQILGHSKQKAEMSKKDVADKLLYASTLGYSSLVTDQLENKASRDMEYAADALGAELIVRAGYDFNRAMDLMDFLNSTNHVDTLGSSHPNPKKRIENVQVSQKYFLKSWINEGRRNYYYTKPLNCKISQDQASIILSPAEKNKNGHYVVEETENLLKRISYTEYKNGNMEEAIKYLKKWADFSNSYIPNLYLSYSYEYLYKKTKAKNALKQAINYANNANLIEPGNVHVAKQLGELLKLKNK